jgi:hypothetical protein
MIDAQLSFLKGFSTALALIVIALKNIFSDGFWDFNAGRFGHRNKFVVLTKAQRTQSFLRASMDCFAGNCECHLKFSLHSW